MINYKGFDCGNFQRRERIGVTALGSTRRLAWQRHVLLPWPIRSWPLLTQTNMQMWQTPPLFQAFFLSSLPDDHWTLTGALDGDLSGLHIFSAASLPAETQKGFLLLWSHNLMRRLSWHTITFKSDPGLTDAICYTVLQERKTVSDGEHFTGRAALPCLSFNWFHFWIHTNGVILCHFLQWKVFKSCFAY